MVTDAPAALNAARNEVTLSLKGATSVLTEALPGKRPTQTEPLGSPAGTLTTAGAVFVVGVRTA